MALARSTFIEFHLRSEVLVLQKTLLFVTLLLKGFPDLT